MAQAACLKSLEHFKYGTSAEEIENGVGVYVYMFDNRPDLRHYFKGAESWTGKEVHTSDRFKKQGQLLLQAVHEMVHAYGTDKFKPFCAGIIDRHIKDNVHLDPVLWKEFWPLFIAYMGTKHAVDDATKNAWLEIGNAFATECNAHLKALGQPSA